MYPDIRSSLAHPERVAAVNRTALVGTAPEQAFDRATRLAATVLDVPIAMVTLVGSEEQYLKSCVGLPAPWHSERTLKVGEGLCPHVVATGEPLVLSDARAVPWLAGNPVIEQFGVAAYAGVPLRSTGGQVLGAFCVADTRPRGWSSEQLAILEDMAASVVTEIELRMALAEAARREREIRARKRERTSLLESAAMLLGTENRILERIGRGEPLQNVLGSLTEAIERQMRGVRCSLLLLDESGQRLRFCAGPSLPDGFNQGVDGVPVGPSSGSCGTAVHRRTVVVVTEIATDPLWAGFRDLAREHGVRACWSAPICASSGTILGTFAIYSHAPRTPTARELQVVQRAAHLAGIVIERERVQLTLRHSEQLFRSLVEHSQDAIVICESDGRVRYGSSSIPRLLGYALEWIPGEQILAFIHPEDRPAVTDAFLSRAERPGMGISMEFRILHADGSWRRFEAYAHNLLDQPAVAGIMVIGRDVTERRLMEEQLRHVQKMEAVGKLAGGVAHDFNNLLTVIRGNASLLALDLDAPREEIASLVAEIREAADRSATLTRQLLAFSRKQVLTLRPFNLNGVVADMQVMLQRLVGAGISLDTDLDPALPLVQADPGQMEQVLLNLVVNARDAMPAGGSMVIRTRGVVLQRPRTHGAFSIPAGSYAVLSVRDSGCGMDETTRTRCFEPFFTTKDVGQGTGLGLATVYGVVRQSRGHITVESRPGDGSLFEVFLPRLDAGEPEPLAEESPAAATRGTETVLLVEEEEAVRRLARRVLERNGYRVLEAGSALQALQAVEEYADRIDLLLTGIVMPEMSGPALAECVARSWPLVRTVLMSGYSEDRLGHDGLPAGMHVLQKPFTPDALAHGIRRVLDG